MKNDNFKKGLLIFRVDANPDIGTGHFMRCVAIAEGWQSIGGECCFIGDYPDQKLVERLHISGICSISIQQSINKTAEIDFLINEIKGLQPEFVVLDGYQFDQNLQERILQSGHRLIVIDDNNHLPSYSTNVLLNPNIYAPELDYAVNSDAKLLLGTSYAILRSEFIRKRHSRAKKGGNLKNLLITMGGSDPENITVKIIEALNRLSENDLNLAVVAGPANKNIRSLENAIANSKFCSELHRDVEDMTKLMEWADLAITAAGSTCWELAFMGVPMIVLAIAGNQKSNAESLGKENYAINLGWHEKVDPQKINKAINDLIHDQATLSLLSLRSNTLIDGYGLDRIFMHLQDHRFRLRDALAEDVKMVWEWANDPTVRGVSFTSEPIEWVEHEKWYKKKINSARCLFFIAIDQEENPIGQVRFDIEGEESTISVSLDSKYRGLGYGSEIIDQGSRLLFHTQAIKKIHAYIKSDNIASIQAFTKAGYSKSEQTMIHNIPAEDLILKREE